MSVPDMLYTIDILFALFVFLFAVGGMRRGLSGELASVLTLLILLFWICFFYPSLTQFAADLWSTLSPRAVQGVVLLVLLLVAVILSFLMNILFKQLFKSRMGAGIDKLAGSSVGFLRGMVMCVSLMAALSLLPNEALYAQLSEKSVIGGWVCNTFTPWLHPRLMELPVFDQGE